MDLAALESNKEFEKQKRLAINILRLSGVPIERTLQASIKDLNMAFAIIWKATGVPEDYVAELFRLALKSLEVGD